MKTKQGKVFLVGAGPGDPKLLTQKACELLAEADIIFYDNLVNPKILTRAKKEAKLVYVGKRGEGKSSDQRLIEDQLVKAARKGKKVLRLKGGDPFIFGRGGEEAQRLNQENILFEIVPGVSSAISVPAYAGIPLTHRNFTSSLAFITGHSSEEEFHVPLDWAALSKIGTLVFLMGVKSIRKNMENLMQAGKDPHTPAAFIRWGTYLRQETYLGSISNIAEEVERLHLMPPAILVVGEVVKLRKEIAWFEKKPLFGKRIVVTRAREQASELSEKLEDLGAEVLKIPSIEIVPPRSWKSLDEALAKLSSYAWMIFTSVNGVHFFMKRLRFLRKDIRELSSVRLAAVGKSTALALEEYHLKVERLPEQFNSAHLAKKFSKKELRRKKILIVRAKEGSEGLISHLQKKGAHLDLAIAYENQFPKNSKLLAAKLIKERPDCFSFTSSSSVENFYRLLHLNKQEHLLSTPSVCIGPVTQKRARKLGFSNLKQASKASLSALVDEILKVF